MHRVRISELASAGLLAGVLCVAAAPSAHAVTARRLANFVLPLSSQGGAGLTGIGDFNGDGHPDFAQGEPFFSSNTGRVRIYLGGVAADTTADVVLNAPVAGESFSLALCGAGDVNGDGFADVLVGTSSTAAHAYLFLGGTTPNGTSDLPFTGVSGEGFSGTLAGAGDVNGDGFDDMLVSSTAASTGAGKVQLYLGGAVLDNLADYTTTGSVSSTGLGRSMAGLGDFNGDGLDDFALGDNIGEAIVYLGKPKVSDIGLEVVFDIGNASSTFGEILSGVGDVDGDGRADLLVAAATDSVGSATQAGRVYAYSGKRGETAPLAIFQGTVAKQKLGIDLGGVGDVDGDGTADFVMMEEQGLAHLVLGGADGLRDAALLPDVPGRNFSATGFVAGLGDWNGDGHPDIVVGARELSGGETRFSIFTTFLYHLTAPSAREVWSAGGSAVVAWRGHDRADVEFSADGGATWTTLAAGAGGRDENTLVVTVPSQITERGVIRLVESGFAPVAGHVVQLPGTLRVVETAAAASVLARQTFTVSGTGGGEGLGVAIANAGDVNGDGYPDALVGAPLNGAGAGRATLYFGGPTQDNVADVTFTGVAGEQLGAAVAGADDVNGDGFADVIVGAPLNDTGASDGGRAYIYFGGSPMNAIADVILTGVDNQENLGAAVAGIGDVNHDGFADVAAGAPLNDAGSFDVGRVYVYFGGASMNSVADLTLSGTAASEHFGSVLCGAGDYNHDGFEDLLVGSPQWGTTFSSLAGRISVFYGSLSMDATPDLTLNGAATAGLGSSVAAGDVNGDGVSDLLVGAPNADVTANGSGSAYVFFGGASADTVADFTLHGAQSFDGLGTAVAFAGDVNGDGIGDWAVGVPFADPAGINSGGRALVFYGGQFSTVPNLVFDGTQTFEGFGQRLTGLGDWQGDGFCDLMIGAPSADTPTVDAGRVRWVMLSRYLLQSPNGAETWNVGALQTVKWLGAEPADVWLSDDGGTSWTLAASHVGGAAANQIQVRVPHQPTRFARIKLTPSLSGANGFDTSDSLFTIQASIALLGLSVATAPSGAGVEVSWNTNPGPADLAGYTLERAITTSGDAPSRGDELDATRWVTVVERTTATRVVDADGSTASRYRLTAINGLGEALVLGETNALPPTPLGAGPLPYRGGELTVRFATTGGLGGATAPAHVGLYDARGRLVRMLVDRTFGPGQQTTRWDGRDDQGHAVPRGVYSLRATSAAHTTTLKLVVLP